MAIKLDEFPCIDPAMMLNHCQERNVPTEPWYRKASSFRIPTGEKPGTGFVMLRRSDFDLLDLSTYHTLTLNSGNGLNPVKLQKIEIVKWENAYGSNEEDPGGVIVVSLADRRITLTKTTSKAFNIRDAAASGWITSTLNAGTPYTWQGIVDYFWNQLFGASAASLPFTPHGTPENFAYWQVPAWKALNDILTRIGCTTVYRPDTDTFSIVRLGVDGSIDTGKSDKLKRRTKFESDEDVNDRIARPEKLRVLFRKATAEITDSGVDPFYAVDGSITPAASGVISDTIVTIYDDLTGTSTNGATKAARAAERLSDWIRIYDFYNYHFHYLYTFTGYDSDAFAYLGSQGYEVAFYDFGNEELSEVTAGIAPNWFTDLSNPRGLSGSGGGGSGTGIIAMITGTKTSGTGAELDYYPATADYATSGGPWVTGPVVRVVNIGIVKLQSGQRYVSNYIGTTAGGDLVYSARDDSATCSGGFLVQDLET